jgi:hypothetical protein
MASLSAFRRTESSVETLCTGVARNSPRTLAKRSVHAVELLADVVVDDARLNAQAVALGGVEGVVRLEERPADQRAEHRQADEEGEPFGGELAREAGFAVGCRRCGRYGHRVDRGRSLFRRRSASRPEDLRVRQRGRSGVGAAHVVRAPRRDRWTRVARAARRPPRATGGRRATKGRTGPDSWEVIGSAAPK